jgi:hypothetical protein
VTMLTDTTRQALRLPAFAMLAGQTLYIVITQLHAGGEANDHHHIFETYAENGIWTAVHLGQFIGIAAILAGMAAVFLTLEPRTGTMKAVAAFGVGLSVAALALYGALQAVDGVALKQTVNAWAAAADAEKTARFASAESIRWLEWGMRSYHDIAMGLALVILVPVMKRAGLSIGMAFLIGVSGLALLAQGWIAGTEGFTSAQSLAIVIGWAASLAWMVWFAMTAWSTIASGESQASEATA